MRHPHKMWIARPSSVRDVTKSLRRDAERSRGAEKSFSMVLAEYASTEATHSVQHSKLRHALGGRDTI